MKRTLHLNIEAKTAVVVIVKGFHNKTSEELNFCWETEVELDTIKKYYGNKTW
tara:strand:- start:537 stop:695 length:159 start_codon:yes stop_codon:yes gene_type:complete